MKKIISLFQRDYTGTRLVYDEVVPGAEWVQAGEGVATVKVDGTACLIKAGRLFKRYDAKNGKVPPPKFVPAQDPDIITGHWPGWVPVGDGPEDKWHRSAFDPNAPDGTYELIGPKVQGNPYGSTYHELVRHGDTRFDEDPPRDYSGLKEFFSANVDEGIVWHRANGDMVKIKRRDFGYNWPEKKATEVSHE